MGVKAVATTATGFALTQRRGSGPGVMVMAKIPLGAICDCLATGHIASLDDLHLQYLS